MLEREIRGIEGVIGALRAMVLEISNHVVAVPFALYYVLAPIVNFDNRAFAYVTLLTFVIQLLVFRSILGSTLAVVPIAFILFTPAHYTEFLWGFIFTQAFSILFPVIGLWLIDRSIAGNDPRWREFVAALGLFLLGVLSSAGALFAFPAAAFLVLLKRRPARETLALLTILVTVFALVYLGTVRQPTTVKVGAHEVYLVLTALGAAVWGAFAALGEFGPDRLSATGAAFVLLAIAIAVRAYVLGAVRVFALPASLFTFSLLILISIAMNRGYLGNWHLLHALPGLCAVYAGAVLLYRKDRTWFGRTTLAVACGLSAITLAGYYNAFTNYGHWYNAYARSIERYDLQYLAQPDQKKPFPGGTPFDVDADMMLFLSARNHELFRPGNEAILAAAAQHSTRVHPALFANGERIEGGSSTIPRQRHLRIVAVFAQAPQGDVVLRAGALTRPMHRIHPRLTNVPDCASGTCFASWIHAGELREGQTRIEVYATR